MDSLGSLSMWLGTEGAKRTGRKWPGCPSQLLSPAQAPSGPSFRPLSLTKLPGSLAMVTPLPLPPPLQRGGESQLLFLSWVSL